MSDLRDGLTHASYLLVTATPYALYLQPDTIQVAPDQKVFQPMYPLFTQLVPTGQGYIGGDFYFEESLIPGTVASFLHIEVEQQELNVLRTPNHPTWTCLHAWPATKSRAASPRDRDLHSRRRHQAAGSKPRRASRSSGSASSSTPRRRTPRTTGSTRW